MPRIANKSAAELKLAVDGKSPITEKVMGLLIVAVETRAYIPERVFRMSGFSSSSARMM